jgi:hypothetical protein
MGNSKGRAFACSREDPRVRGGSIDDGESRCIVANG